VSNPDLIGERVTWGGTFVSAQHRVDTTELEIVAFPLDECGRPLRQRAPLGRFVLAYPGFLETADLRAGREVIATGEVIGVRDGLVGDTRYRVPVLEDASPRIWPEESPAPIVRRPVFSIGIGAGSGWSGGGVGVRF
jgi:outer membrane lipoprotein